MDFLESRVFHILIELRSPKFQLQMFFFPPASRLVKPLDKNVAPVFFPLPLGDAPNNPHAPFPRLSQRDPCHNKAGVRLARSFNAKTQSEAVRNTSRKNKEYFCSRSPSPAPPPLRDHKHGDSTEELLHSFFKSNVCFCTGNTLVIRRRKRGERGERGGN